MPNILLDWSLLFAFFLGSSHYRPFQGSNGVNRGRGGESKRPLLGDGGQGVRGRGWFAISPGKGRKQFQKIVAGKLISLLPLFTPFPLWVSFLS